MISRILVPTDFSDLSLQGLDYAVDLAQRLRARLVIVFVLEPIRSIVPTGLDSAVSGTATLLAEQRQIAEEQLGNLTKRLGKKRGLDFQTVLATGMAHEQIVETAKRIQADLVVMATHGRTGFSHVLLGSVAEKVVRLAPCPVLTVRSKADAERARPSATRRKSRTRRP